MKTEEMMEILKDRRPLFRLMDAYVYHPILGYLKLTKRNGDSLSVDEAHELAKDWPTLILMDDIYDA